MGISAHCVPAPFFVEKTLQDSRKQLAERLPASDPMRWLATLGAQCWLARVDGGEKGCCPNSLVASAWRRVCAVDKGGPRSND